MILIDVRTESEWNVGHLKDAILIPYDEIADKIRCVVKDYKRPIGLYCKSGMRAEIALKTLELMGYTDIKNLGSYEMLR